MSKKKRGLHDSFDNIIARQTAPKHSSPPTTTLAAKSQAMLRIFEEPSSTPVSLDSEPVETLSLPNTSFTAQIQSLPEPSTLPYRNPIPYRPDRVSDSDTVSKSDTLSESDRAKETPSYLKIPHYISDVLAPQLTPNQWALYYQLYRLSHGWGQESCFIGYKRLQERTHLKLTVLRETITSLKTLGLIEVSEIVNTKNEKGTVYKIYTQLPADTVSESDRVLVFDTLSDSDTVSESDTNKRHDHDDLIKTDHHQRAVMTLYQTLTGKAWTKGDTGHYKKVAHLSLERLEVLMRVIHTRSSEPIGSFAYFARSIQKEETPQASDSRAATKKKMEKILKQVREIHVGDHQFNLSDLAYETKIRCIREGITWNDDIFNELTSSR